MLNTEQKIEEAKLAGWYLIALLFSLAFLLWNVWNQWGIIMTTISISIFGYFLYQVVSINAYPLFKEIILKAIKFQRVHNFFDQNQKQQVHNLDKLRKFGENKVEERSKSPRDRHERSKSSRKNEKSKDKSLRLHINKTKTIKAKHKKEDFEEQIEKTLKQEEFIKTRDAYKQTLKFLSEKEVKQEVIDQIQSFVKGDYTKKVEQIIFMSEQNQQNIISQIQQNYEVKVMMSTDNLPEKLEPVLFDQVLDRLKLLHFTKSLPWTEKKMEEQTQHKVFQQLGELLKIRKEIDLLISPLKQLSSMERSKLIQNIRNQLNEKIPWEKSILMILITLFNKNIKAAEYKLQFPKIGKSKPGLQIVESFISDYYHVDLKIVKEGKPKLLILKPGADNIWNLLAVSAQIYKLKL